MKRRFFSIVMALVLCLGLLPGTAWAADELEPEVEYSLDGGENWIEYDKLSDVLYKVDGYLSVSNPKIRLKRDIIYDVHGAIILAGDEQQVELDGQGHTVKRGSGCDTQIFTLSNVTNASLTLKNITIDGGAVWDGVENVEGRTNSDLSIESNAHLIYVQSGCTGSTITLGDKVVLQNNDIVSSQNGSAVCMETGTLIMNEGSVIRGNAANSFNNLGGDAGAVYIGRGAEFIMNGGEICCNYASESGGAVEIVSGGTFTMNGGKIHNNASGGNGGAIRMDGTMTMIGGEITDNSSDIGGGVCNLGTLNISGGKFNGNVATTGGSICLFSGTVNISGGEFNGNSATNGGGVFINSGTINMSGGEIKDNTATRGIDIYNPSGGKLNLSSTPTIGRVFLGGGSIIISDGFEPRQPVRIDVNQPRFGIIVASYAQGATANPSDALKFESTATGFYTMNYDNNGTPLIIINKGIGITFDSQGGSEVEGQTLKAAGQATRPKDPVKRGHTFGGWYKEAACETEWNFADTVDSDVTIYAGWTVNSYKITINSQNGDAPIETEADYGTKLTAPADPEREHYTFGGWYRDAACTKAWNFNTDTVDGETTLYAKWIPDSHTITFDSQDGSESATIQADYGTKLTAPAAPTRSGYTFGGWYKEAACENAWNFENDTVTGNVTIYAKWTPNKHTVTFDSQGGSEVAPVTVDYGTKLTAPTAPTRSGYTFGGWYKETACTNAWDFDTDTVTETMTLYAKWTANTTPSTPSTPSGSGGSGGGSSGGGSSTSTAPSTPTLPVNTTGQNNSAVTTTTTAAPTAANQGGMASSTVNSAVGSEIVKQAVENKSENVVIAPKVTGDVSKATVSIPAATVGEIGSKTSADLTIFTPVAEVTIPNGGLGSLSSVSGSVTVTAEQKDGTVELTITADGKTVEDIPGGVTVTVPAADTTPGTVAVLVHEDGTREVVRKSVADGDSITIPLDGSAKLEIVDNSKQFADVPSNSWAADAVAFASAHELFSGTAEDQFSPDQPMSRGMLAVVLHNLENNPNQTMTDVFVDVHSGDWYAKGIAWAAANGIVDGYGSGKFGPDDNITREQLAVMLWRYAGRPAASRELRFPDADQASGWALEALRWAAENGILSGSGDGRLNPRGLATRAQAAQMLKSLLSR